MTDTLLRASAAKPDRNSRQVVERAIELSKGTRDGAWGIRVKRSNPLIHQWETPPTDRQTPKKETAKK